MNRQPLHVDGRWGWTRQERDISPFGLPSSVFDKLPGRSPRNPHFVSYATRREALAALAAAGPIPEGVKPPILGRKAKTPRCVNLRQRFGDRYKITFDPALEVRGDPWMMQIPCRFGTIYPHGGDILAVECDYHPGIAARITALGLYERQSGHSERTFLFHVDDFAKVAEVVKPRRRHPPRKGRTAAEMANVRAQSLRKSAIDGAK